MSDTPAKFSVYPLFWLAVALALGVVAPLPLWAALAGGAACTVFAGVFFFKKSHNTSIWLTLLAFVCLGAALARLETRTIENSNRVRLLYQDGVVPDGAPVALTGVVSAAPENAPDGWRVLLRVETLQHNEIIHTTGGKVVLFVPTQDAAQRAAWAALDARYGARLRVPVALKKADEFRNPGVSTRTEYLAQRDYDASASVKEPLLCQRLDDAWVFPPWAWLYAWRQILADAIRRTFERETAGVLQASLLGLRHWLSKDASERFREGGTFHVLVISGLHITFIGGLVWFVAQRVTHRRKVQFALSVGLIWAYTFMVGAEASVVRAALMFTLAMYAPSLHRARRSLNALGGTALALLAGRPRDLFDPAFQLTFLSVFAIVALAWPVWQKLEEIGRWHPTAETPVPPSGPRWWRALGEALFWSEKDWQDELARASYHCRLFKTPWAGRLERWGVQRWARWIAGGVWVSACVQVVMLPLMVLYFHRVSWASLVLNIFVGALMAVLSLVALVALAFPAGFLVKLAHGLNWLMVHSVDPFAAWGVASWRVGEYNGWMAAVYGLYFVPVCVLAAWAWRWNPFEIADAKEGMPDAKSAIWHLASPGKAALSLAILFCLLIFHPFSARPDGRLHVSFLDVGQGDATLLTMPDGTTILVDGGGKLQFGRKNAEAFEPDTRSIGEGVVSEYLWWRGLSRVDYLLATHADLDHIDGLHDVARNFTVRTALAGHAPPDDAEFTRWANTLQSRKVPLKLVKRGDALRFGDVIIETLWPEGDPQASSDNNASVVWRVRYGQRSFLLTGDIEAKTEEILAQQPDSLCADVVKVAHHGSRTSSTQAFVNAVRPSWAVASVGLHSMFGHPRPEVVARWRDSGAQFWTTGQKGLIEFSTDGQDLQVATFVP